MRKTNILARTSALPAIAAVLALTSTTALAQQAQPVTTDSTPPAATAEPTPETVTTAPDSSATTPVAPDPAATVETAQKKTTTTRTHSVRTASVKPAQTTRTVSRTTTTHAAAPAKTAAPATAAAAKPAAPAPEPAAPAAKQSSVTPVVDMNAKSASTQPAKTKSTNPDETVPMAAGGAAALLLLGGAAYAISRRRRRADEDEWYEEEQMTNEPVETVHEDHEPMIHDEQPAILAPAPSAFAWGNETPATTQGTATSASSSDDDRMPGETWVERAYRGPSANNPSASLKNRLKRAAFFDKRERDVAAGKAVPVSMDAGLPDAMVEEQERELA